MTVETSPGILGCYQRHGYSWDETPLVHLPRSSCRPTGFCCHLLSITASASTTLLMRSASFLLRSFGIPIRRTTTPGLMGIGNVISEIAFASLAVETTTVGVASGF